jgi:cytoplasmic iron level regulating protein YaaA (DUF328/UPF0246 family)
MGTALPTPRGKDLYAFWGDRCRRAPERSGWPKRALRPWSSTWPRSNTPAPHCGPALQPRVVDCVFEDWKDGRYKIISFFAKRAAG